MNRLTIVVASSLLLIGCKPRASGDVLSQTGTTSVARVTQCTQGNPDGVRCDVKTCTKDTRSDCAIFRDRCKASGHDYDGNDDAGTCTRREEVG